MRSMSSVFSRVALVAVIIFWGLTAGASAFLPHWPPLQDSDFTTEMPATHLKRDTGGVRLSKTTTGTTLNGEYAAVQDNRLQKLLARLGLGSHPSRASLDDNADSTGKRAVDASSSISLNSLPHLASDDETLAHHEKDDQRNKGYRLGKRSSKQRLNSDGGQFSGFPVSSG